jgi:HD-GYP domain-containing protein (c-di-GMP phosphodiesterase class II)
LPDATRHFTAADADLLTLLAGQAANAIHRAGLFEETVRRASELEAIATVSTALRAAAARADMLPIILEQMMNLLKADGAAVDTYDSSAGVAVLEMGRGVWAPGTGRQAPLQAGVAGRILASRKPYVTADVHADGLAYHDDLNSPVKAVAAMPLLAHSDIIGALWVGREPPFTPDEVRLLTALADLAANALYRATLHEQTVRRAEQLAAMNSLARSLAETLDLNQIYERLAETVFRLLPDTAGLYIYLYDPAQSLITCGYAVQDGVPLEVAARPPIPLEAPGVGTQSEAIHTRQPVIVNNPGERPTPGRDPITTGGASSPGPDSGLYVPMLAKGRVIGMVQVQSHTAQRYGDADADLLAVAANTGAVAIENARLFAQTGLRLRQMQALHSIDTAISSSLDLRMTLSVILEQTIAQLRVDAADVLLLNQYSHVLTFAAGRGFRSRAIERTQLRLGEGQAGQAALERHVVTLTDIERSDEVFAQAEVLASEGIRAYSAVPLVSKGFVVGVLEVFQRAPFIPDAEWLDFLETLAGQAAIAVDNAELFDTVQRSNMELSVAYDATIEGWSRALDLRDRETEGHTRRVTETTLRLARALGQADDLLIHLRRGALLHDIGKMGIPDSILLKPGPLTEAEWEVMRQHPVYAHDMLAPIHYLRAALDIPYSHHEKWDGSGYPRGLTGDMIPLAARIFAVVDVWDALRSDRPYRQGWPDEEVLSYLRTHSGTHFDPQVVEAFLRLLAQPPAD